MKLRIRGNSLRLRLLRSEVEQFGKTGQVIETIQFSSFPAAKLSYVLESNNTVQEISANFADNKITISIPEEIARSWVESELVTLEAEQSIESNATDNALKILVEKDFVCLDR